MRSLRKEEDFYDLTRAYLEQARAQGVVHAEVFVDPQAHLTRGVALDSLFGGVKRAFDDEQKRTDGAVSCTLIACFLRERGSEEALRVFSELEPYVKYAILF